MTKLQLGGSPCTHWSIAQSKNRETTPSGVGWELFMNYTIAKERFHPHFFLYENNKSAAPAIKDQISRELGAELQYINSALVSAQNRQRFYCHNFGDVPQPADRGILLRDVLESGVEWTDKSYALTARYHGAIAYDTLKKHRRTMVAEPVGVGYRNRREADGKLYRRFETDGDPKANALTRVQTDSMVAEPIRIGTMPNSQGELTNSQSRRIYSTEGKARTLNASATGGCCDTSSPHTGLYAEPIRIGTADSLPIMDQICLYPVNPKTRNYENDSKAYRVYSTEGKATTLCASDGGIGVSTGLYATPPFPGAKPVYRVQNGMIEIKGQLYPIKLPDGYYIIRKLTVTECCRLQTMPDNYCRAVSATQAYKGLGNGWTAEVIIHLLSHALRGVPRDEKIVVLSMYDGIGTGRYCLDKMGFRNVDYYAYEIDKYAIQVAMSNYPDIIQCGDAFQVREDGWGLDEGRIAV